jgi:tetratricopeptide (TPR) repeat protein
MAADFVRFGRSLVRPFFSGFAGIPDGVYSTFWGDGLWGGVSGVAWRTPWNYELMTSGYLLAVVPTILILTGAGVAVYNYVRRPSTEWFFLFAFCALVIYAFLLTTLAGSYAQIKAFYALSALTPLCCFAAIGWNALTRGRKRLQFVLGALFLVWAMNSFASMWVRESAQQHVYNAARWSFEPYLNVAYSEGVKAVAADPTDEMPHRFLSVVTAQLERFPEAVAHAERAVQLAPLSSDTHMQLSAVLMKQGQLERAVSETRRAIELGPENVFAYSVLFNSLLQLERIEQAVAVARDALKVAPFDHELHYSFGLAAGRAGDFATAAHQFAYAWLLRPELPELPDQFHLALRLLAKEPNALEQLKELGGLASDSPQMLDDLAWLLATFPDPSVRDGQEAVRLAERACTITDRIDPISLAALAAAQAETGNFRNAIATAQEALVRARLTADTSAANLAETLLSSFALNRPYREEPSP